MDEKQRIGMPNFPGLDFIQYQIFNFNLQQKISAFLSEFATPFILPRMIRQVSYVGQKSKAEYRQVTLSRNK